MASQVLVRKRAVRNSLYRIEDAAQSVGVNAVTWVIGAALTVPFLWMLSASLQPDTATLGNRWFSQFRWQNYVEALSDPDFAFAPALRNTLIIAVPHTILLVGSSLLVAYGFAYFRFPWRDQLFFFMILTMMLPGYIMTIPNYMLWNWLGWVGTYKPLIWPGVFAGPAYVFLLRQFMLTLETSLFEAAVIDGAGYWQILWRIVVPNIKAPILVITIQSFQAAWEDYFGPLIYLGNFKATRTLALALTTFVWQYWSEWSHLMVGGVVISLVPIALYFYSQRKLMPGFVLGSAEK